MFLANKLNKGAGTPTALDAQFNYVTMLLHGDGTNGAQNNTFLDSSTNNFTITRNGNTTQGSFSPYGSNWSNYFGGTGNYLTTATSASAFSFGTGDFTIEFWINSTQTTRCDPIGQNNTFSSSGWWGLIGNLSSSGQLQWFENATSRISATATNWNNGSWNHIAVTRSGNSVRMFVNGTQVGSTYTTSFTYGASSVGVIAGVLSDDKTTGPLTGYLSNFRIVKGTALYTGTFTPSTTPLTAVSGTSLLTCQANRFFDASTNALAITTTGTPSVQRFNPFGASTAYSTSVIGGSGYFDGSGDYLTGPTNNAAFQFGTGDFTIEMWVYTANLSAYQTLLEIRSADSLSPYGLFIDNNGKPYLYDASGIQASSIGVTANAWTHLAFVRTSGTFKIFVNGTSGYSASNTNSEDANGLLKIGDNFSSGAFYLGYLSNYRIVKGTAVYTSNFTPPTSPLTAISGTSLLLNFTNGAIFDNAMMNDLETVGNAQISTSVYKYGTGSMYFDGTGDWLSILNTPTSTVWGTESWTIEGWIYPTAVDSTYRTLYVNGYPIQIYQKSGSVEIYISSINGFSYIVNGLTGPTSSVSANIWTHFAVVKNGNDYKVYVNGIGGSTVTSSTAIAYTSATNAFIGDASIFGSYPFAGYIDDFRITKGYARYTANFTPPTAAFSNTGPI